MLLWSLGLLLLLLIVLLAVPVDLQFRLYTPGPGGRVSLGWLYGWVRIPIDIRGKEKPPASKPAKPTGKQKRKPAARGNAARLLRSGEFWSWLRRLLKSLLKQIRIDHLFVKLRLGLGDPADTGILWAWIGPLAAMVSELPVAKIHIEPNFYAAELLLESDGKVRIYPLQLIGVAVATLFSPTSWRLMRRYRIPR